MPTADTDIDPLRIDWAREKIVPSKKCESRVMVTLHRKGEWGRGRDLPASRLNEIQEVCDKNDMTLYQALSLRRTMLRSFKGGMKRVTCSDAMGGNNGQQQIASLFEEALVSFLSSCFKDQVNEKVFITEADLLTEMKEGSRPRGPTPDILFLRPVSINGRLVKWMEAKMYYASASFANHKKIPNGKLKSIAERYNAFYGGEGAFVFGQGFCANLQDIVENALLLDATPLNMTKVNDYQNSN